MKTGYRKGNKRLLPQPPLVKGESPKTNARDKRRELAMATMKANMQKRNGNYVLDYTFDNIPVTSVSFSSLVEALAFRELLNNLGTLEAKLQILTKEPLDWWTATIKVAEEKLERKPAANKKPTKEKSIEQLKKEYLKKDKD